MHHVSKVKTESKKQKIAGCLLHQSQRGAFLDLFIINNKNKKQNTDSDNQKNAEYQISAKNWSTPIYSIHICK